MPTSRGKVRRTWRSRLLFLTPVLPLLIGGPMTGEPSTPARRPQVGDTLSYFLGQPRPGPEPELFAEGIVSTDGGMYGTVVFSPDQTMAFWAKDEERGLFFSRYSGGEWSAPAEFPFPREYRLSSPFFSVNGRRLYFLVAGQDEAGMDRDEKIWVVDRVGDGWGEPSELDPVVNSLNKHWQFSLDRSGNVFFMAESADIYVSELRDGRYGAPTRLPSPVNTNAPESSPNISPDGDFLLFDRWFETPPYVRIMVSFRGPDGGWGEPVDLSPYTKSEGNDSAARISPDGRYLFFQSAREGSDPNRSVFWMEAAFLEGLRPGAPLNGAAQDVPASSGGL